MLPFIKPKAVTIPANDITMSEFIFEGDRAASPEAIRARQTYQEKKSKIKKGSILLLGFRQMRFYTWVAYKAVTRIFTSSNFIKLQVKGFTFRWQIDTTAGWALDEGRALDRVVKHRLTV